MAEDLPQFRASLMWGLVQNRPQGFGKLSGFAEIGNSLHDLPVIEIVLNPVFRNKDRITAEGDAVFNIEIFRHLKINHNFIIGPETDQLTGFGFN